jgi:hypothetical protein
LSSAAPGARSISRRPVLDRFAASFLSSSRRAAARQVKCDVHDTRFAARRHGKAAAFEYLQHRGVVRQHFGDKLIPASRAMRRGGATGRGDSTVLVRVVHREGDLGAARFRNDVPPAACDTRRSTFPITCERLTKSTSRKNSISRSLKVSFGAKNRL